MADRNGLITGGTRGIGFYTARALALRGMHVILVGHDADHGADAVARIDQAAGAGRADFLLADLSAMDEVRRLARRVRERYARLDVLVNNVGAAFMRRRESADGIEMTLALNHLSYFALTCLLLDMLKASAPARIVNVSSGAHYGAKMNWQDLGFKKGYRLFRAYGQSKLANLLFTYELARRLQGSGVTVNAVHPGFVNSHFYSEMGGILSPLIRLVISLFAKSSEQGAETPIYLAALPEVTGISGRYYVDKQPVSSSPASYDQEAARRLWEISREMTGVTC